MKIILEAEGVKRELTGPFNIAISRADLATLRTQLERIDAEWEVSGCYYGWASVYPKATGPGPTQRQCLGRNGKEPIAQVRYRRMTARQWDGTGEAFEHISALLMQQGISENISRGDGGQFDSGKDRIKFFLLHRRDYNMNIALGSWLVVPIVLRAEPVILSDYDFHAQFVEI